MSLHPMKLVTVICESVLEELVVELLRDCGVQGHTAFDVRGSGSQGLRNAEMRECGNVQIEVIVKPEAASSLLENLRAKFFEHFAMVAYESEVRVLRPQKF